MISRYKIRQQRAFCKKGCISEERAKELLFTIPERVTLVKSQKILRAETKDYYIPLKQYNNFPNYKIKPNPPTPFVFSSPSTSSTSQIASQLAPLKSRVLVQEYT